MPPEAEPVPLESGIILAFDTSAAHCAAAVLSGDRVITRVEPMAKGQAERLVPMLDEVLAEAGVSWGDLAAIGVGTGPGNFTGIRIAVALARGLALGLKVPAIGVTGFEAMAPAAKHPFWAVIDAPRDQSYVQRQGAETHAPRSVALADLDMLTAMLRIRSSTEICDIHSKGASSVSRSARATLLAACVSAPWRCT